VAYIVGWMVQGRWRVAVGVGAVPALLQGVMLLVTPESPRWLVMKGRTQEARGVLGRLGEVEGLDLLMDRMEQEVKMEGLTKERGGWQQSFRDLVYVPGHRRALTIACMLQGVQQLCGFVSRGVFPSVVRI